MKTIDEHIEKVLSKFLQALSDHNHGMVSNLTEELKRLLDHKKNSQRRPRPLIFEVLL
jgi:hypothetical protein